MMSLSVDIMSLQILLDKWDKAYIQTAQVFADLSHSKKLKVGAIIVKDNRIISIGYNGMPAGWSNECEDEEITEFASYTTSALITKKEVIHAEANAIAKLARSNESGLNADMYITHSPCLECAKQIYSAGIQTVYFMQPYKNADGIEFLHKCGVGVIDVSDL